MMASTSAVGSSTNTDCACSNNQLIYCLLKPADTQITLSLILLRVPFKHNISTLSVDCHNKFNFLGMGGGADRVVT